MSISFQITTKKLKPKQIADPTSGAVVTFEGVVRNHSEGNKVEGLYYEAYEELALKEGKRILLQATTLFPINHIHAVHRIGQLEIGDSAIHIQVHAAHRREAFAAAEYAMDEIKRSVPIWKKELYTDNEPSWIRGETQNQYEELFSRQVILDEVGAEGQKVLANARVLIVGAGGLGTPALEYLVRAGVGAISIVDCDFVETSNLNRQISFYPNDKGMPKAWLAAQKLSSFVHCQIEAIQADVKDIALDDLIARHDVVLDCTDDIEAKYLLNDVCINQGKPLVSASIFKWQGQVLIVKKSPCLRCLLPEPPPKECVGTCEQDGVVGTIAGIFGVLQANETVKVLLGLETDLQNHLFTMDLLANDIMKIKRHNSKVCPICSESSEYKQNEILEISITELVKMQSVVIVDVRKDQSSPMPEKIGGHPVCDCLETVEGKPDHIVLVCNSGRSSLQKAYQLRDQGINSVLSLHGGLNGLTSCND